MRRRRHVSRFGWIPDLPDHRDLVYSAPRAVLRKLPPTTNLTAQCPGVYDQGELGSCTANAIGAAIQFDRMKQKLKPFMPSRLFIYYNERVMENTVSEDAGAMIRDGIKSVAKQGVCSEKLWPYDPEPFPPNPYLTKKPTPPCYKEALRHTAVQYQRISRNLSQMKRLSRGRVSVRYRVHGLRKFRKRRGSTDWQDADAFTARKRCRRTRRARCGL